ncbi:MAG: translocation/assembly module TamB domain-containing protein, partial [Acidobacteria bacterium]|nr:translocation/assembly module TamB domain-containing protein [Acidobacteriota bacterium]
AANLEIRQLRIAELQQIANLDYPAEGLVSASVQLRGSEVNPLGQGRVQITNARIADESLRTVSAQFHARDGTVHSNLLVGVMSAEVSYTPKTQAYELKLQSSPLDLSRSHNVQARNLPLKGLVSVNANGRGTIGDPRLTASIEINQLQLEETSFSRADAQLDVENHMAKLALSSGVSGAALRGKATVRLGPPYSVEASLDTSKFAFDPFLALYMPSLPSGLRGETEMHASVRGPLADMTKLEAHVTIPVLDAKYQSIEVAASRPIRASYINSLLTVEPARIQGTDTSLEFQGRIPVNRPGAIEVSARGSIGIGLAQMFNPDLRTGGDIRLDLVATGTLANPAVKGQIRLEKISLASEELPLGLQDLNALMEITDTGIQITSGSGQLGNGQVTLGGSVTYRPELRMNVLASAKGVRLRYPEGVRTVFDSNLTLTGDQHASLLQGRVLIDSVSFSSYFDLSSLMSQFGEGTAPPATNGGLADKMRLQIDVQSTTQLSAGTSQLGIEGNANLRIIGTASDPVVTGRADLTSGEIFFDKNRYTLERGVITFANPNRTEPVLNMLITTTINQYNLSITVRGPIEKLETSYVSDPSLPPIDIINLIARGQTTSAANGGSRVGANEVLA